MQASRHFIAGVLSFLVLLSYFTPWAAITTDGATRQMFGVDSPFGYVVFAFAIIAVLWSLVNMIKGFSCFTLQVTTSGVSLLLFFLCAVMLLGQRRAYMGGDGTGEFAFTSFFYLAIAAHIGWFVLSLAWMTDRDNRAFAQMAAEKAPIRHLPA